MTDHTQEARKALQSASKMAEQFAVNYSELMDNLHIDPNAKTEASKAMLIKLLVSTKTAPAIEVAGERIIDTVLRERPAEAFRMLKQSFETSTNVEFRLKNAEVLIQHFLQTIPPVPPTAAPEPKSEKIDLKTFVPRLHGKSIHEEEVDALREKLEKQAVSDIVADYNDGKYEDAAGALNHLNRIIPKR